jgi:signal peptidase II
MHTSRTRVGVVLLAVGGAMAVDQLTKWLALRALGDGSSIALIPTVELDLTYNSGFSFSTGTGNGRLVGLMVIALCFVLALLAARARTLPRLALMSVILGGALGNLVDRVARAENGFLTGEVVDFVDVSWYAVFNVADSLVVVGALALGLTELVAGYRQKKVTVGAPSIDPAGG